MIEVKGGDNESYDVFIATEDIHGFKAFNADMTCFQFQYAPNQTYKMEVDPIMCARGFHFCELSTDILEYYRKIDAVYARVVAPKGSSIVQYDDKTVTNIITIGDMLTRDDIFTLMPAKVTRTDGTLQWFKNGLLHSYDDNPAVIYPSGTRVWCKNGFIHRKKDLPAIIYTNGTMAWYKQAKYSRSDNKPVVVMTEAKKAN